MITDRLLVDPGELLAKASEVQAERGRIADALAEALSEIRSLGAAWQSPAADAYMSQFARQHDELQNILAILDKYVKDLIASADTFASGEKALASMNEALPVINIVR